MSEPTQTPSIRLNKEGMQIHFPSLFGPDNEKQAREFVRRVFEFPQLSQIQLQHGTAFLRFPQNGTEGERKAFLAQLAGAVGGQGAGIEETLLPVWNANESTLLNRFGRLISLFEILQTGPARLQFRHPAIIQDAQLGRRLENALRQFDGVKDATATAATGRLWVSYEPKATDVIGLIRLAEAQLLSKGTQIATIEPQPSNLVFANTTLGLAALGEFALPVVLPVCVGLLVVSNLGHIRDAGKQLSQGKIGLPVLYTALLGCSITTGQIVAHALMDWSFKFWERRSNNALAAECKNLLEQTLPIPAQSRLIRSDEVDALVESASLKPGQRIRIEGPSAVAVDGVVVSGVALVEQFSLKGDRYPVRKSSGDEVLAGSRILNGQIELEVQRVGAETRAAQIAHQVIETTRNLNYDPYLKRQAESIADRPVVPNLAIAAVGWTVGGLFTVGAVLHQDHASGPKMALPLETLRDNHIALRNGVVVRRPDAWLRLAASRFVVLDDHPAWQAPVVLLEAMHSRLPETETDKLLRLIAGAGLYLGDGRSEALVEVCRERGLVVRQLPLVNLGEDRLSIRQGDQTIILRSDAEEEGQPQSLQVEIDGREVAWLKFRWSPIPRAFLVVQKLQRQGIPVFVLSSGPQTQAQALAAQLGTELFGGEFNTEEKVKFLQSLKKRGVLPTYIGAGPLSPALAREAHLAISLGANPSQPDPEADLLLLGDSLDSYSEIFDLSLSQAERIQQTCRKSRWPNVLCIIGGYAGLLNGITSGILANVGVNRVYQQTSHSLREIQSQGRPLG